MKICKVVTILFVLMLVTSSVFAAPGGQAGGAVNPPGQTTYGTDDWSLSDCIQWSREAGCWNVENKPNEFVHWWLFGYSE